jgi:hypothetical protein
MLATRQLTSRLLTQASRLPKPAPQTLRLLSTTPVFQGKDPKMSSSPPKHEMVYFPQLTSEVRAFGQFRKVLHTGLFSQLVSMEIPVGGDIGDEVHTVDQVLIFTSSLMVGQASLIIPTGHQSLRRRRRARWHSAPVHQHLQDSAAGVGNCVQSCRAR